jgi:hypothetical protein
MCVCVCVYVCVSVYLAIFPLSTLFLHSHPSYSHPSNHANVCVCVCLSLLFVLCTCFAQPSQKPLSDTRFRQMYKRSAQLPSDKFDSVQGLNEMIERRVDINGRWDRFQHDFHTRFYPENYRKPAATSAYRRQSQSQPQPTK